jgi:hypothetical protein
MKNVRMPNFLENLYRDMRDRRLLLPALALVIAVLAVPILLKSQSSGNTAPPATVESSSASDSKAIPAVVTQQLGVTNYRKRLNQLQSKNPFHQQYTTTPKSAQLHITSTGGSSSTTSSTSTGIPSTSTSTTSSSTSYVPPVSSTPVNGGTSPSTGSSPPVVVRHTKPTFHLYTYRVAVKVGKPSKLAERNEVKRLALLPSKGKPIATFIGTSEDAKQALFLISTDVDSVSGDGHCIPKHSNCLYLMMKPGDKESFHYAPDGNRYNLILEDVHAVEVGNKPPAKVSGKAATGQKLPKLGPG